MTRIVHKGDDFLALQETIAGMAIEMGAVNFNHLEDWSGVDDINCDLKITLTKLRKKNDSN